MTQRFPLIRTFLSDTFLQGPLQKNPLIQHPFKSPTASDIQLSFGNSTMAMCWGEREREREREGRQSLRRIWCVFFRSEVHLSSQGDWGSNYHWEQRARTNTPRLPVLSIFVLVMTDREWEGKKGASVCYHCLFHIFVMTIKGKVKVW